MTNTVIARVNEMKQNAEIQKIMMKHMVMNTKEKQLAAKMLEMASDEFSNHGCNDVEDSVYEGWTLDERQQFVKEFHEWNGDPENFDKDWLHLEDSTIMSFLAYKLETDAS